jgi:hypothetical protein
MSATQEKLDKDLEVIAELSVQLKALGFTESEGANGVTLTRPDGYYWVTNSKYDDGYEISVCHGSHQCSRGVGWDDLRMEDIPDILDEVSN